MEKIHIPADIEHYEKKIYDLTQLIEISKSLNSTLDFSALIESVLLTMIGHIQTFKAGIFLNQDIEDPNFYLHSNSKGFEPEQDSKSIIIKSNSNLIDFFIKDTHVLTLRQIEQMDNSSISLLLKKLAVEIVIPLKVKERIVGIIILGKKESNEEYSDGDKDFLLTLAAITAIAVENARLYELATVDMQTRLKIHHYFQTRLAAERERTRREKTSLCLLITDIDNFKKFNDTYGHQTGDIVLKKIAQILIECIRTYDIAARYGGEEFAVILPNTETKTALVIAERIRSVVEKTKVPSNYGPLSVQISIGVAKFDWEKDITNHELIEKADKALYQAKKLGRNKIMFFDSM